MSMSYETTAAQVASYYDDACKAYDAALRATCDKAAAATRPGESVRLPSKPDAEDSAYAREQIGAIRDKALEAVSRARSTATAALVVSPSNEATNYLISIQGRDNLTEAEVSAALDKYRDHASQSAIIAAARRSGLKQYDYARTEHEQAAAMYDDLEARVNRNFDVFSIGSAPSAERVLTRRDFQYSRPGADMISNFKAVFGTE